MKNKWLFGCALVLVLTGAGCSWFANGSGKIKEILPAGPRPADFEGASPAEASKRINFVPGSQIEISQLGVQKDANDKEGVRIVTIERFAPMVYANLSWKLRNESDASAEAESSGQASATPTKPGQIIAISPEVTAEIITEDQTAIGYLEGIDLKKTHSIYPPAYWPTVKSDGKDTSGIWLSDDAFLQLSKSRLATINYGLTDDKLYGAMKTDKGFSSAVRSLNEQTTRLAVDQEIDLIKAEDQSSEWTLKVNGKDVKVQVIKAKSWFGEMVVLDNPQNPLILKLTFEPSSWTADNASKNLLTALIGYEVTALEGVQ